MGIKRVLGCNRVALGYELLNREVGESGHKSAFHHISVHIFADVLLWMP
jgi:hypothetical protein